MGFWNLNVNVKKCSWPYESRIQLKEIQKLQLFFWRKQAERNFGKENITARRSTEWFFIKSFKNISISKLTVETVLKNIAFAL